MWQPPPAFKIGDRVILVPPTLSSPGIVMDYAGYNQKGRVHTVVVRDILTGHDTIYREDALTPDSQEA